MACNETCMQSAPSWAPYCTVCDHQSTLPIDYRSVIGLFHGSIVYLLPLSHAIRHTGWWGLYTCCLSLLADVYRPTPYTFFCDVGLYLTRTNAVAIDNDRSIDRSIETDKNCSLSTVLTATLKKCKNHKKGILPKITSPTYVNIMLAGRAIYFADVFLVYNFGGIRSRNLEIFLAVTSVTFNRGGGAARQGGDQ